MLPSREPMDWAQHRAARWRRDAFGGHFAPVAALDAIDLDDLLGVDDQKRRLVANTEQFVRGYPANNALLWGARGTGKSSLIHALLNRYAEDGLRVVEVSKEALADIAAVASHLADERFRFLLVCDDLSFEAGDASYKALKSALEGSLLARGDIPSRPPAEGAVHARGRTPSRPSAEGVFHARGSTPSRTPAEGSFARSGNILIYATSNRRHLLPEHMADNEAARHVRGELHESEAVEEKISLSDRFGLWLSFHPFRQDDYLRVAEHWVGRLGAAHGLRIEWRDDVRQAALRWALARGGRSGRVAYHFAKQQVGAALLAASQSAPDGGEGRAEADG